LRDIGEWVESLPPSLSVPDKLLSMILNYWFNSWKVKGVPLETFLKEWERRLPGYMEEPLD
tara:strand:+ start:270 stop:452 length:183 start_codon:yes stop_codon:yes gene_type:complete